MCSVERMDSFMTYSIRKTAHFDKWLKSLKDLRGRVQILNPHQLLNDLDNEG